MSLQLKTNLQLKNVLPCLASELEVKQKEEKYYDTHPEVTRPVKLKHEYVPALEYCGWLSPEDQAIVKPTYPYCCFNHLIGLPTIKYEDEFGNVIGESQPMPLYEYEEKVIINYEATNYYAINKCRGAGLSEILSVRHMLYKYVTTRTMNRKCLILGGIRLAESIEYMARIKELADKIPFMYRVTPKSESPIVIVFKMGMIIACPSSPNVVRSYQNVGDVMLEESAFWHLNDDEPVLKAAEPHVAKSSAHIGVISTPNGQRGFFWTKIFNPEVSSRYYKHVLNWKEVIDVEKPVLSEEVIMNTMKTDLATYEQEFNNQFLLSESRAFGEFKTADFEPEEFTEYEF